MRRRKAVKAIALSTVTPHFLFRESNQGKNGRQNAPTSEPLTFESTWSNWPDMRWTGPDFWGNRLQDWEVIDGQAVCVVSDENRTLHCLTCQLSEASKSFETSVILQPLFNDNLRHATNYVGFVVGAKGIFEDYRSAAVFGKGLNAGITTEGKLFIGNRRGDLAIPTAQKIRLVMHATPDASGYTLKLAAYRLSGEVLDELEASDIRGEDLAGNIALTAHFSAVESNAEKPSVAFSEWVIKGEKVRQAPNQTFGPVCFAQYTLHKKILKLTAQLAPIEAIAGHQVFLEVKDGGQWKILKESRVDPLGRSAHFRIEAWPYSGDVPYRVRVNLPLKRGMVNYFYEGRIAGEPMKESEVKMAVFSCNGDHGFPDADVPLHVAKHQPHLAVFLGDQFYESTGGFRIQTSPLEKASLDYLRKWYMFGWSYRDVFRNIPAACIPDDHDVYHGNVWGEGGKKAPTDEGWNYVAQDKGGYKMPAEWVNMVQRTQTSHLPDPFDPTPVDQGIGVYYTSWSYGGISMAILEDRKFKSAPKQKLPSEASVVNGFIQNPDFDIKAHHPADAQLLGDRQMKFLDAWADDWQEGTVMKAVLSQTNFCTVATLPEGSILDNIVPGLRIPEPGEYVKGDAPTTDMDSNGWPQKGRNEALRIIRKAFALHIAGDQHLASMVRYGVEEFGDAGYAFAGPALNNIWPRRWWPPVEGHQPLPGKPAYTGDFHDGFGNKMTVLAVANPRKTGKKPAIIHDRVTGYGIVTFHKENRTMKIECWPRHADPEKEPHGQYEGWPVTVSQQDNYGRKAIGYLPTLNIAGVEDPVVQVISEENGEVQYTLRIKGKAFRPKIFSHGKHTVKVSHPETRREKSLQGLSAADGKNAIVELKL